MRQLWARAVSLLSPRRPSPAARVEASFDRRYYLATYEDVRAAGMDPWQHYLLHGAQEGRRPHPSFDTQGYLRRYADVADTDGDPFEHYVVHGWKEGRQPLQGLVCDPLATRHEADDPVSFNPFHHLVSASGTFHDWHERVRELAATDPDGAIQLCRVWMRNGGNQDPRAVLSLGELLISTGDLEGASAELDAALDRDPGDPRPRVLLAECALRGGSRARFDDALRRLETAAPGLLDAPAPPAAVARLQAYRRLNEGRLLEAIAIFDRLAAGDHEDGLSFLGRGLALLQLGSTAEALDDHSRALRLNPRLANASGVESAFAGLAGCGLGDREARCSEARAHAHGGRTAAAAAEYTALLEQFPEDRYLEFRALESSDRLGRPTAAPEGPITGEPGSLEIGRALLQAGRHDAAGSCFEASARQAAGEAARAEALAGLARCQLRAGRYALARETAARALAIDPRLGGARVVIGAASRRLGERAEAIARYRAAIEAGPQEPWVYRDLAVELDRRGDRLEAIGVLAAGGAIHWTDPELDRDRRRLVWLDRLHHLRDSISGARAADRPVSTEEEQEFVTLLRNFIDAGWPVAGRDFAECRVCMDAVIRGGESWPLHEAYGDLLVRCGDKFDGVGRYEEAHRVAAGHGAHEAVRAILRKIIAALEQLELYERCLPYLDLYVRGQPPATCRQEYRRLACYNAMLDEPDKAREYWSAALSP